MSDSSTMSGTFKLGHGDHQRRFTLQDATPRRSLSEAYRPKSLGEMVGQGVNVFRLESFLEAPYSCAMLFDGPTGVGKTTAALALAAELGAVEYGGLEIIKSGTQDAEAVERCLDSLRYTPMLGSGWKVIVVEEADYMSQKASQIWLSALEDLPGRSVVIFTTNNPDKFPARFQDRCERFTFSADAANAQDAQALVDAVWAGELGRRDDSPRVAALGGILDADGNLSYRRVVRALEPLILAAKLAPTPKPEPTPEIDPVNDERDEARAIQDRFLSLGCVRRFVAEHGDTVSLWHLGPNARDVRAMIFPALRGRFEEAIREQGPDDDEPAVAVETVSADTVDAKAEKRKAAAKKGAETRKRNKEAKAAAEVVAETPAVEPTPEPEPAAEVAPAAPELRPASAEQRADLVDAVRELDSAKSRWVGTVRAAGYYRANEYVRPQVRQAAKDVRHYVRVGNELGVDVRGALRGIGFGLVLTGERNTPTCLMGNPERIRARITRKVAEARYATLSRKAEVTAETPTIGTVSADTNREPAGFLALEQSVQTQTVCLHGHTEPLTTATAAADPLPPSGIFGTLTAKEPAMCGTVAMIRKVVCGYEITLAEGRRYRAARPMARLADQRFTVTVTCLDDGEEVWAVTNLSYDEANEFLSCFNNGPTSFEGRVW